jgi:hypothetical protein
MRADGVAAVDSVELTELTDLLRFRGLGVGVTSGVTGKASSDGVATCDGITGSDGVTSGDVVGVGVASLALLRLKAKTFFFGLPPRFEDGVEDGVGDGAGVGASSFAKRYA